MFSRDVSVFKSAKVYFSVGGVYFTSSPIVFQHSPDRSSESARQVIIPVVSGRVGRSVRLSLQFDLRWIMISEVRFVSGKRTRISSSLHEPHLLDSTVFAFNFLLHLREECEVLQLACMYVSLSVCQLAHVENHRLNFTKFSVRVTCDRGSILP